MLPPLIIRADADYQKGIGHIIRCLSLSQAYHRAGGRVTFLSYCENKRLQEKILGEGFVFMPAGASPSGNEDIGKIKKHVKNQHHIKERVPWVVIDGYHFLSGYHQCLREAGFRTLVIDDTAHLENYQADILLNQNIGAEDIKYKTGGNTILLLGTRYALLGTHYIDFKNQAHPIEDEARNILVTFGGSDTPNVTLKVIQSLDSLAQKELQVKVIIGPTNRHRPSVERELSRASFDSQVLYAVDNMPELMTWADLAITAGGSTCWELAFMGLPSIIIATAENQRRTGEGLNDKGAALYLGDAIRLGRGTLSEAIKELIADKIKRHSFSLRGRELVDGWGSKRLVRLIQFLENKEVETCLRRVAEGDSENIYKLANDPEVRQNSFSLASIPWDGHRRWFQEKMKAKDSLVFVLDVAGIFAGQIRYEKEEDAASVHFSLTAPFRGRGLGGRMIENTYKEAGRLLDVKFVRGYVKKGNVPSIRSFINSGFKEKGAEEIKGSECLVFEKEC